MVVKVLYFSAEWCGPCSTQSPIVDDVKDEWKNNEDVVFEKIDVDDNQKTANKYSVRSLPTIAILVEEEFEETEEEVVERFVGVSQEDVITEAIQDALDS